MARRSLFLLLFPFAILPLAFYLAKRTPSTCRCFPDDLCWPSLAEWGALNTSISGNLIPTTPIGSVCHVDNVFAPYSREECSNLLANWAFPETHYETSSSPMAAWWANSSCSPFSDANSSCTIGPLVRYAANVTSATDVQKVLSFADQHNIRVVIRNTGHDYLGKSSGAGAIALWMHHLKSIRHEAEYTSSWYTGPALRIGAGVQGFEAENAAHKLGLMVVTGHCPDVGITGGYTQGGGHGQLASRFGLAADQVLEWEVVTATGKLLIASPAQNADLYWALSGGGGGTFAVVISMTVRVYPEEKTASGVLQFASSTDLSRFWAVVRTYLVDTLPLLDAGGSALWFVLPNPADPDALIFSAAPITLPGGGKEDLEPHLGSTLQALDTYDIPYSTFLRPLSGTASLILETLEYAITPYPSYHSCFAATTSAMNITEYHLGGQLVSRATLQSNTDRFMAVIQNLLQRNVAVSGYSLNVSRANHKPPSNAVNPIWRKTVISLVIGLYVTQESPPYILLCLLVLPTNDVRSFHAQAETKTGHLTTQTDNPILTTRDS